MTTISVLTAQKLAIPKLVDALRKYANAYYNTDESLVSDEEYDKLMDILKSRDPTNKFLQEVGAAPVSKDAVELPYPMASLNKIKLSDPIAVFESWYSKYSGPFVVSDKLDGVSGMIYKNKNGDCKLFTRGNATSGQDITHLIDYLIPDHSQIPNNTAIRGEIIISKKNFETISASFKNARNTVAGLVNAKHYSSDTAELATFIGYAIVYPYMNADTQMDKLIEWGIKTVHNKIYLKDELDINVLSERLSKRRKACKYEIDGIVVVDASSKYISATDNPKNAFAFKKMFDDQIINACVLDVEWSVSKNGLIKPRLALQPVELDGVTISYATAFNAKFVFDNCLGPGAIIKLVRSGSVIPHVLETIKPATNNKPKMPDIDYQWNETQVDIITSNATDETKNAIIIKQISDFFSVMGIKYISEGLVTKFVNAGYNSVYSILNANTRELAKIDGIGEKIVGKMMENTISAFNTIKLETLMDASNTFGRGLGTRKLGIIIQAYPNILAEKWSHIMMKNKIVDLDGFDDITALQFVNNLDAFKRFFEELQGLQLIQTSMQRLAKPQIYEKKGSAFDNCKIVFSGFRDKKMEEYIISQGGQITTSVSKNTSLVYYSDTNSAKYLKAIELNIPTKTRENFSY